MSSIPDNIYIKLIQTQELISKLQDKLANDNQKLLNKLSIILTEPEHTLIDRIEKILFDFDTTDLIQRRNFKTKEIF